MKKKMEIKMIDLDGNIEVVMMFGKRKETISFHVDMDQFQHSVLYHHLLVGYYLDQLKQSIAKAGKELPKSFWSIFKKGE